MGITGSGPDGGNPFDPNDRSGRNKLYGRPMSEFQVRRGVKKEMEREKEVRNRGLDRVGMDKASDKAGTTTKSDS